MPDALALDFASFVAALERGEKYAADQPRVAAGNPGGGQWTQGRGGTTTRPRRRGRDLILYHGTNATFDLHEAKPVSTSANNMGLLGNVETVRYGIFFTSTPRFGRTYGSRLVKSIVHVENTARITDELRDEFLKTINPWDNNEAELWRAARWARHDWQLFENEVGARFVTFLKGKGYDSATYDEETTDAEGKAVGGRTVVVFDANAIQSHEDVKAVGKGRGYWAPHKGRPDEQGGSAPRDSAPIQSHEVKDAMRADAATRGQVGFGRYEQRFAKGPLHYISMHTREPWQGETEITYDDFDPDAEWQLIQDVAQRYRDLLNDPAGQDLARAIDRNGEFMIANANRSNGMNVIFTNQAKDVGMGSGGERSARVFWMPYSLKDQSGGWESDRYKYDFGLDPIYVMVHELHHAYGSGSELDIWSDAVALDMNLAINRGLHPTAVRYTLENMIYATERRAAGSLKEYNQQARKVIKFLYRRHPEAMEAVIRDRFGDDSEYTTAYMKRLKTW